MQRLIQRYVPIFLAALVAFVALSSPAQAQTEDCAQTLNDLAESEDPYAAKRFVTCAAAHVDAVGWEQAQKDFRHEPRWSNDSVYLFAHNLEGLNLFNASRAVPPDDYRQDATDADGFRYVQRFLYVVEGFGGGFVYYRFHNPATERAEPKITYVHGLEVDEGPIYLGAGFYPDAVPGACAETVVRASLVQTMADLETFVACAALHLQQRGLVALHELATAPRWKSGPTYLFLADRTTHVTVFNGGNPALAGVGMADVADTRGYLLSRDMERVVSLYGEGAIYYDWPNPASGQVEGKASYVRNVPMAGFDYFLGAGLYLPPRAECRALTPAREVDTMAELRTHVACAADLVQERGADAFDLLLHHPLWRDGSTYVVVMDERCQNLLYASDYDADASCRDNPNANGRFVGQEIMALATGPEGEGTLSYAWPNPANGKTENKTVYVQRIHLDGALVAVVSGIYAGHTE